MIVRKIEEKDNQAIAAIIRHNLEINRLDLPGTSYTDPQLDNLYYYYSSRITGEYWVIEHNGKILGGAGFDCVPGYPEIAEIQKMYVDVKHQGKGMGSLLMDRVIERSSIKGYEFLYLETSDHLSAALPFYNKYGFENLKQPIDSPASHHAMTIWMMRSLKVKDLN